MLPYILFYVLLFLLALWYKRNQKVVLIYFICFSVFYSFAINIGPDWHNYKVYFDHLTLINHFWEIPAKLPDNEARFEWGFHLLSFLLTRGGYNYNLIILVFNTLSFFVYKRVFDYFFKNDSLVLFTIFIMFYGNRLFVSTLRQNLSVCFFYLCIVLFMEKDKGWIFSLIASCLFHTTGILVLLVILTYKYFNKRIFLIISIILVITGIAGIQIGQLLPNIILTLFHSFIPTAVKRIINLLLYGQLRERDLLSLLQFCMITFILVVDRKEDDFENVEFLKVAYSMVIISYLMKFHFTNIPLLMSRLKYNFGLGYIIIVYNFIIKYNKYSLIKLLPLLYTFMITTYSFYIVPEDYVCYVPYENVLVNSVKFIDKENIFSMKKFNKRLKVIGKKAESL